MKPYRSERFKQWLKDTYSRCQRCQAIAPNEAAHSPTHRRPWNGGMSQKPSDYSCLYLDSLCHRIEHDKVADSWPKDLRFRRVHGNVIVHVKLNARDLVCLSNLNAYAEHLDPGIDLFAEVMEWTQKFVSDLELIKDVQEGPTKRLTTTDYGIEATASDG